MNIGCRSRGPGFDAQHPHGGSRSPLTLVPGDMKLSSGLHRYCSTERCTKTGKTRWGGGQVGVECHDFPVRAQEGRPNREDLCKQPQNFTFLREHFKEAVSLAVN